MMPGASSTLVGVLLITRYLLQGIKSEISSVRPKNGERLSKFSVGASFSADEKQLSLISESHSEVYFDGSRPMASSSNPEANKSTRQLLPLSSESSMWSKPNLTGEMVSNRLKSLDVYVLPELPKLELVPFGFTFLTSVFVLAFLDESLRTLYLELYGLVSTSVPSMLLKEEWEPTISLSSVA